ncbi:MAG: hypothetical protein M1840_007130 [Geoglossum simile]|nr:MAG: hypothetical protein M1840_007130 [Geoglossum simile]
MAADGADTSTSAEADLAQAFSDLSKGERTAAALESHLTSLERKLDEFLASLDGDLPAAVQSAALVGTREDRDMAAAEGGVGSTQGKGGAEGESANGQ